MYCMTFVSHLGGSIDCHQYGVCSSYKGRDVDYYTSFSEKKKSWKIDYLNSAG